MVKSSFIYSLLNSALSAEMSVMPLLTQGCVQVWAHVLLLELAGIFSVGWYYN